MGMCVCVYAGMRGCVFWCMFMGVCIGSCVGMGVSLYVL